jgi:S1-C subfamily serine protease
MTKKFFTMLILMLFSISLVGCSSLFSNDNNSNGKGVINEIIIVEYRVNYYIDGELKYYATNYENQVIKRPDADPIKENHTFLGWYSDDGELYDFSTPLKKSFSLHAKFQMDYTKILNLISTEYMSTNVEVRVKHWNSGFLGLGEIDVMSGSGSGVIFADANGKYYVLTNNHVVYGHNRKYHEYKIQDYKGNTYTASLFSGSAKAEYDLATLGFTKGSEKLVVSKIAKKNPILNEEVISIGQPGGQNNAITFGVIQQYRTATLINTPIEESNVKFDVIKHSAPGARGSSGGVLMNSSFEIVGINYAGPANTNFNDSSYGLSIPAEKIKEYLELYIYE